MIASDLPLTVSDFNRLFTVSRRNCIAGAQGRAVRPPPVNEPAVLQEPAGSRALSNCGCGHDFWRSVAHERRSAGGDRLRPRSRAPFRDVGRRVAGYRHFRISPERRGSTRRLQRLSDFDHRAAHRHESPDARSWRRDPRIRRPYAARARAFRRSPRASTRSPGRSTTSARRERPARAPAPLAADDTHLIDDVLSRLDRKIDRLRRRSASTETGAHARSTVRARSTVDRPVPAWPRPDNPLDQALAEIEARQRMLDGGPAAAPIDLPRAPTQSLPDLEQQLRQINARIETHAPLRRSTPRSRPCATISPRSA